MFRSLKNDRTGKSRLLHGHLFVFDIENISNSELEAFYQIDHLDG